jgi:hypothetical protein
MSYTYTRALKTASPELDKVRFFLSLLFPLQPTPSTVNPKPTEFHGILRAECYMLAPNVLKKFT